MTKSKRTPPRWKETTSCSCGKPITLEEKGWGFCADGHATIMYVPTHKERMKVWIEELIAS